MSCQIKLAEKNDAEAVVELLNKVTLNLHEKNINQWTYPWDFEKITEDIINRNLYLIAVDELVIGTFSLKDMGVNAKLHINKPNNLCFYRIAILPEYQGRNIGLEAVKYAASLSKSSKKALYLDCWAGNEKLKNFYSKAGFNFCGDFPEEDYMISVFKYI